MTSKALGKILFVEDEEDIRTVANKYMKNLRFVVIGNPAAVNKSVFIPTS